MSDNRKQSDRAVRAMMDAITNGLNFQDWMHPDWKSFGKRAPEIIDGEFTVVSTNASSLSAPVAEPPSEPVRESGEKPLWYTPNGQGGVDFTYPDPDKPKGWTI